MLYHFMKKIIITAIMLFMTSFTIAYACDYQNKIELKTLSNSFEAWKAITSEMAKCGNVESELDKDFRKKHAAALKADPALYHIVGISNGTMVPLLADNSIRPLDGYVKKYGKNLKPNQLIKIDGNIKAIAFMVNAQHLMYREDILKKADVSVPKTYDDVLAVAEKIKAMGLVDYPLGGTYKSGWNLAEEFVNMYLGFNGQFFAGNNAAVNNDAGVKALEMMKKLTAYMDPEYLTSDSTFVQKQFQEGKIAMANLWASRAAAMDNKEESNVVGKVNFATAPAAYKGGNPATTLWWDGLVISKNITEKQADAAFQLIVASLSEKMVKANNAAAIWLVDGYNPGRFSKGAVESAQNGAPGYPSSTKMGLMHSALGNNIADFLTGAKSARDTLKAVEDAYTTAAKEKGIL